MKPEQNLSLFTTKDNSTTLFSPHYQEHYHSRHGARSEAFHVFIKHGLLTHSATATLSILEMGFGTGLNVLYTLQHHPSHQYIRYTSIDNTPLPTKIAQRFAETFSKTDSQTLTKLHKLSWNYAHQISDTFSLTKQLCNIQDFVPNGTYDVIYYDAFSPRHQPECWTTDIFSRLYTAMSSGGCLVTYCAQGKLKRCLKAIGFRVETCEGPPGKREMIRAIR